MADRTARRGFDWDTEQKNLLEPVERIDTAQNGRRNSIWPSPLRGHATLYAFGLIFVIALAHEKDVMSQLRSGATISFEMLEVVGSTPDDATALPEGLVVYTRAQAERFARDLRLADEQTLRGYVARTSADIAKAERNLRPFYQDAQLLLMSELARRRPNAS